MERYTYKVIPKGKMWGIQAFQFGAPQYVLNIQIFNELQAEKFCQVLNEEADENFREGQASSY